jgi:hypothetical protein
MSTIDLVISYYKEELGWLEKYKDVKFNKIYLYNKGPNSPPETDTPYIEIKLENIGRCDHTYLYHIISKYDELADVTIFTTGSVDLPYKSEKLKYIVKKTVETNNTVFEGTYYSNVRDRLYDFQISEYSSAYERNDTKAKMEVSKIRPFGKWYDLHFKGIYIDLFNTKGIFSVSKKHIQQHTKKYYENLIADFPNNSNPEVGHYFERAWLAVFYPIPRECMTYNYYYDIFSWEFPAFILFAIIILILILFIMLNTKPIQNLGKKLFNKSLIYLKG